MILDKQNVFFEDKKSSSIVAGALGDVVANAADCHNQMYLYVSPLDSGSVDVELQTDDAEGFSSAVTLGKYTLGTKAIKARVPVGVKKYLRIKLGTPSSAVSAAGITGALVVDVDF